MRTQLATLLPRRKEAFEEKYPHTKKGVAQGAKASAKPKQLRRAGYSQPQFAVELGEPKDDAFTADTAAKNWQSRDNY